MRIVDNILSRNVSVKHREIGKLSLLFVPQLTDRQMLAEFVVKPLTMHKKIQIDEMEHQTAVSDIEAETDIEKKVLGGMSVLLISDTEYIVLNTKSVANRGIADPKISYTLRGPKDSLSENMDSSLSLIRYRIKDSRLKTENFKVGRRTHTNIAVMYLEDVANSSVVKEVGKRLNAIDTDGILESGELQQFLTVGKWSLFPQLGIIERSDMACGAILEGKIVILVEGSGIALVAPKTFPEFLTSGDDLYDNKFFGIYSKIMRYISVVSMLVLMPLYVAIVSFNTEILSADYTITLASLRSHVPFNALFEALIVTFIVELLRESLLRVPKEVGAAIGMAGGVIIGQAMVSAGIFSMIALIIATLSLMMSFTAPDYTIINPLRILQPFLILCAGMFGLFGVTAGVFIIVAKMAKSDSFGVPFLAPLSPLNWKDAAQTVYYSKTDFTERPKFLNLKDKIRGKKN